MSDSRKHSSKSSDRPSQANRILEAAVSLFAQKGFSGTTTRMIADRARMNEALIFRHFPTKRDLYAAIIETKIAADPICSVIDLQAIDPRDDRALLRAIGERILGSVEEDPDFLRLLYFSGLEGHELSKMFFDSYAQRMSRFLADRIADGVREGRLRAESPYLAARAFIGMLAHHALTKVIFGIEGDEASREEMVGVCVEIFLKGVQKGVDG